MASPTDILVAGGIVNEGAPAGTVVAVLNAEDPDSGESFTYALTGDLSGFFEIVGSEIRVKAGAVLDYEAAVFHNITVQVTDSREIPMKSLSRSPCTISMRSPGRRMMILR